MPSNTPRSITITINPNGFTCNPDRKVNPSSWVTFQLGERRDHALVCLNTTCFRQPSIELNRHATPPVLSLLLQIQGNVVKGLYNFETSSGATIVAGQPHREDAEIEPLIGDVEVVTDPDLDKDPRKKGQTLPRASRP